VLASLSGTSSPPKTWIEHRARSASGAWRSVSGDTSKAPTEVAHKLGVTLDDADRAAPSQSWLPARRLAMPTRASMPGVEQIGMKLR